MAMSDASTVSSTIDNSTSSPDTFLDPSIDSTVPVVIVMSIVAILANLATILAFYMDQTVRSKPSDFIILNLACADMGVGVFIMPRLALVKSLGRWVFGEIGCRVAYMLESTFLNAGIYLVILLSFDRYKMLSLEYSVYLKRYNHIGYMRKVILLTWLAASLQGFVENCLWNFTLASLATHRRPPYNIICAHPSLFKKAGTIAGLVIVIIPVLTVAVLGLLINIKLFTRLRKWTRVGQVHEESLRGAPSTSNTNVHNTVQGPSGDGNTQAAHPTAGENSTSFVRPQQDQSVERPNNARNNRIIGNRYIKPIITYTALVLSLLVCTIPLNAASVVISFCRECGVTYFILSNLFILLLFNSCINPTLYALTNARIRGFFQRQLKAMRRTIMG